MRKYVVFKTIESADVFILLTYVCVLSITQSFIYIYLKTVKFSGKKRSNGSQSNRLYLGAYKGRVNECYAIIYHYHAKEDKPFS